ncbi:MAG: hypothetical protein LBL20_00205 [Treponema sp.]|nr:hypothetical protein [Treponema sp.]
MTGVTTTTTREFKTDGAIAVTIQQGDNAPTSSVVYYLVKDNFLILSTGSSPFYVKYLFEVIDNNNIKVTQDAGSTSFYTRVGVENPNVNRTTSLTTGINGYFRSNTVTGASTMYDWYTFKDDGSYHVYHWMNNDPHYIDRGDFSYYIDSGNRFVSITNGHTVRVWADFTRNNTSDPKTIGWNDGQAKTLNEFDGETFTITP